MGRKGWLLLFLGEEGPIVTGKKKEKEARRSRDKVTNRKGRIMVNKLKERGWMILNGSFNREKEWTYIGEQGSSVIDYVVTKEKEDIKRERGMGNRAEKLKEKKEGLREQNMMLKE